MSLTPLEAELLRALKRNLDAVRNYPGGGVLFEQSQEVIFKAETQQSRTYDRELTLEEKAIELYVDGKNVKPRWDQLGEVTKSVWRDLAIDGVCPEGWEIWPPSKLTNRDINNA